MTTHELAVGLEQLAAELRERPNVETGYSSSIKHPFHLHHYCTDKEELQQFARIGNLVKQWADNDLELIFGAGIFRLKAYASRNRICKIVKPAEYECEPLLTPDEENALTEGS